MFEKILSGLFYRTPKKKSITVLSQKREITEKFAAIKKPDFKTFYGNDFWENRGKVYGALFTSLNNRTI